MWTKFVAFALGPIGSLIGKGLLITMAAGMIWFAVHTYNEGIRTTERDNNQIAQLQQIVKDNQDLNKKLGDLQTINTQILTVTAEKNNRVDNKHNEVTHYIQSPEGQKSNRDTSDVIRNTIGMLQNEE